MKTFKKIILDDLKSQGLTEIVKCIKSIRYRSFSMGDAVDVTTKNLFKDEREQLEKILNEYQAGNFNGMEDIYEYDRNSTKERQAKYVHLRNEFDDELKELSKNQLKEKFGVVDSETAHEKMGVHYETAVWRNLNDMKRAV